MTTSVARKGIYALNLTVTHDRYGSDFSWGLRTNCPHYLIETSRGHRDEPHTEPLVLLNPDAPGDVCFMPPTRACTVDISAVPEDVDAVRVYDAEDNTLAIIPVADGAAQY
ncbi:MAG TPA: hypothetical protein ENN80_13980, partial [Candidatus Hydrogenedentes bacterium]|nr:hypothetical protein [Candidatus Hydrogenedentota bacterium]